MGQKTSVCNAQGSFDKDMFTYPNCAATSGFGRVVKGECFYAQCLHCVKCAAKPWFGPIAGLRSGKGRRGVADRQVSSVKADTGH